MLCSIWSVVCLWLFQWSACELAGLAKCTSILDNCIYHLPFVVWSLSRVIVGERAVVRRTVDDFWLGHWPVNITYNRPLPGLPSPARSHSNYHWYSRFKPFTMGVFLLDDPDQDHWCKIIRIMVHQRNGRILVQSGFIGFFDATWSEWSWITNPDPDHPKGKHPINML